jgi:dTDP-4-dehydrorhamnose 3,5-epimerase
VLTNKNSSTKSFELEGVRIFNLDRIPDERGFFLEAARKDWSEFYSADWISQANISCSYPSMIRAWHRHARGQIDYFLVLGGSMKIVAYDGDTNSKTYSKLVEIVASEHKPQIVRIPGHYWHGTKTLGEKQSLTLYFVNNLYEYKNPDEERRPWNDASIVDPKTGESYDWNMPPHK